jgi:hypothetical protein
MSKFSDTDPIKEVRLQIQAVMDMLNEIDAYLYQIISARELRDDALGPEQSDIAARLNAATRPRVSSDSRQPYLAGRQPRRDGDSYGSVQPVAAGGSLDHDPAGALRPSGQRRG